MSRPDRLPGALGLVRGDGLSGPRRGPVLLVAGGAAIVGLLLGALGGPGAGRAGRSGGTPSEGAVSVVQQRPLVSSWFCAGATSGPGTQAPGEILLANAGLRPVNATTVVVSENGRRQTTATEVAPGAVTVVHERMAGPRPAGGWVGAIVTLYGGMTSVSQSVVTGRGTSVQPCATATSPRWYFAAGEDLRNAHEELSLLNPYPVDAVVDLSFTTEQGVEVPGQFQGIVVPARGLAEVDLAAHLRRRRHIALTLTARTGAVAAFETEVAQRPPPGAAPVGAPGAVNPVLPVGGATLQLGTTSASTRWWWPAGGEGPGLTEEYAVYDPEGSPAKVKLQLLPSGGGPVGTTSVTVPAHGWVSLKTNGQTWSLPGVRYGARLTSLNGAAVVAQRTVMAASPSTSRGLGALLGLVQPARVWALTNLEVPEGESWLQVTDPGGQTARVRLYEVSGGSWRLLPGEKGLVIGPGQSATAVLPGALTAALVVVSSVPTLVDRASYSLSASSGTDYSPLAMVRTSSSYLTGRT